MFSCRQSSDSIKTLVNIVKLRFIKAFENLVTSRTLTRIRRVVYSLLKTLLYDYRDYLQFYNRELNTLTILTIFLYLNVNKLHLLL